MSQRQFEFVTYNGPQRRVPGDLRRVRVHVMHDYFQKTGKKGRKGGAGNRKHGAGPGNNDSSKEKGKGEQRRLSLPTRDQQSAVSQPLVDFVEASFCVALGKIGPRFYRIEEPRPSIQADLGARCMDPFDVLPVQGHQMGRTIPWYFAEGNLKSNQIPPWLEATNNMWQQWFWDIASQDGGLFHILLSIAEYNRACITGQQNSSDYLYHHGKALGVMRSSLPVEEAKTTDAFILQISTQISRSLGEEDWEAAKMHMRAICQLMERKVSTPESPMDLHALSYVHVIVNDIRIASVTRQKPTIRFNPPSVAPPKKLENEAVRRARSNLGVLPSEFGSAAGHNMLKLLNQLSLILDYDFASTVGPEQSSTIEMVTVNCICSLVGGLPPSHSTRYGPVDIVTLCTLAFAWTCIPTDRPKAYYSSVTSNINAGIVVQILEGLGPDTDMVALWSQAQAPLESLLWCLTIAIASACDAMLGTRRKVTHADLARLLEPLQALLPLLGIRELDALETLLKRFPWTQHGIFVARTLLGLVMRRVGSGEGSVALSSLADDAGEEAEEEEEEEEEDMLMSLAHELFGLYHDRCDVHKIIPHLLVSFKFPI